MCVKSKLEEKNLISMPMENNFQTPTLAPLLSTLFIDLISITWILLESTRPPSLF